MFILYGIVSGLFATLLFDIFLTSLSFAYNLKISKWHLVGRYFIGLKEKKYFIENIQTEKEIKNELLYGYFIHYLIGSIFGIIYVTINLFFYTQPSILLALFSGFVTVLGGWCLMMPYVYNIGFFANKKVDQKQILIQNLIAHFIFGIGLYLGYLIIF